MFPYISLTEFSSKLNIFTSYSLQFCRLLTAINTVCYSRFVIQLVWFCSSGCVMTYLTMLHAAVSSFLALQRFCLLRYPQHYNRPVKLKTGFWPNLKLDLTFCPQHSVCVHILHLGDSKSHRMSCWVLISAKYGAKCWTVCSVC